MVGTGVVILLRKRLSRVRLLRRGGAGKWNSWSGNWVAVFRVRDACGEVPVPVTARTSKARTVVAVYEMYTEAYTRNVK